MTDQSPPSVCMCVCVCKEKESAKEREEIESKCVKGKKEKESGGGRKTKRGLGDRSRFCWLSIWFHGTFLPVRFVSSIWKCY